MSDEEPVCKAINNDLVNNIWYDSVHEIPSRHDRTLVRFVSQTDRLNTNSTKNRKQSALKLINSLFDCSDYKIWFQTSTNQKHATNTKLRNSNTEIYLRNFRFWIQFIDLAN